MTTAKKIVMMARPTNSQLVLIYMPKDKWTTLRAISKACGISGPALNGTIGKLVRDGKVQRMEITGSVDRYLYGRFSQQESRAKGGAALPEHQAELQDMKIDTEGIERDCCGTFFRTPHRSTCKNYRGKKGGAA